MSWLTKRDTLKKVRKVVAARCSYNPVVPNDEFMKQPRLGFNSTKHVRALAPDLRAEFDGQNLELFKPDIGTPKKVTDLRDVVYDRIRQLKKIPDVEDAVIEAVKAVSGKVTVKPTDVIHSSSGLKISDDKKLAKRVRREIFPYVQSIGVLKVNCEQAETVQDLIDIAWALVPQNRK